MLSKFFVFFIIILQNLIKVSNSSSFIIYLNNRYNLQYDQTFYIGSPPQELTMIFDTSSSWIQIPSINCTNCVETSRFDCSLSETCNENKTDIFIKNLAFGHLIQDSLYLEKEVGIINQTMFLILKELNKNQDEGVLGLGLDGILANSSRSLLLNLQNQGIIENKIFSFYFTTSKFSTTISSQIMIGDYNNSLIKTNLRYFNLSNNQSWGFNACNFSLDSHIIDNRTHSVLINSAMDSITAPFDSYMNLLGYLKQNFEGCFSIGDQIQCSCPFGLSSFPSFKFFIEDYQLTLEPDYFISEENSVCSIKILSQETNGEYWVVGLGFLQKYCTVFDAEDIRIGLAECIKAELVYGVIYKDTILIGIILFASFFIGLALIWAIKKATKWNEKKEIKDFELI